MPFEETAEQPPSPSPPLPKRGSFLLGCCLPLFLSPAPLCFPVAAGGTSSRGTCIQDRSDGFIAFLLVTMLPAGVYVATHLVVLVSWFHLWSLLLLGAGPLLFVTCLPGEQGQAPRERKGGREKGGALGMCWAHRRSVLG